MPDPADEIAREVLAALTQGRQITPFSERDPGFDFALAYRSAAVLRRLREARGERAVGRKIGFTDRTIWPQYSVDVPIWGYMYDTTVHRIADRTERFAVAGLVEPRIEPEIVFALARTPEPGMDERALLACVAWVAHGFEIVQSLYPGWHFKAPDTVAALGLRAALFIGSPQQVTPANLGAWHEQLATFEITLLRNGVEADRGGATKVMGGGPLSALHYLVALLAQDADNAPLSPGEIVTTGTLTRALPIVAGEIWSTSITGLPLSGIELALG
jgi:2-oxo-3-hexenedioate decarboxylase